MDISLLWYGVFAVFMGELAVVTPPVGILAFIIHTITKDPEVNRGQDISMNDVFKAVLVVHADGDRRDRRPDLLPADRDLHPRPDVRGVAMFLSIDADKCMGHGRCYSVAPDLLTDDEEGFVAQRGQTAGGAGRAGRPGAGRGVRVPGKCDHRSAETADA